MFVDLDFFKIEPPEGMAVKRVKSCSASWGLFEDSLRKMVDSVRKKGGNPLEIFIYYEDLEGEDMFEGTLLEYLETECEESLEEYLEE